MEKKKTEEKTEERLEEKHESDLTKKERRLLEKKKLENMDWKGKLEYIWMYYKMYMLIVVAVIAAVFLARDIYENAKTKTILSVIIIDGGLADALKLQGDIEKTIGCEGKYEQVEVQANLVTVQDDPTQLDYASNITLAARIQTGGVDVLLVHETMYESMAEQGYFKKLEDVLGAETCRTLGEAADTFGLRTSAAALGQGNAIPYDPVYMCVMLNAENAENAAKWMNAVIDGSYGGPQSAGETAGQPENGTEDILADPS